MEFLGRRDDYVCRFKVKVRNAGALPPFPCVQLFLCLGRWTVYCVNAFRSALLQVLGVDLSEAQFVR